MSMKLPSRDAPFSASITGRDRRLRRQADRLPALRGTTGPADTTSDDCPACQVRGAAQRPGIEYVPAVVTGKLGSRHSRPPPRLAIDDDLPGLRPKSRQDARVDAVRCVDGPLDVPCREFGFGANVDDCDLLGRRRDLPAVVERL